jgi:hypothetical protein
VSLPNLFARLVTRPCFRLRTVEIVHGVEISGSEEFLSRTKEALELLRPTPFFSEIQRTIAVIKQGRRSGMWAATQRPTFVVGKRTWSHSALWYAGAIAHDSYHSKLYHDARESSDGNPAADCWTGREAEKKCLAFQIEVMKTLGADADTVAYLKELEKNPAYQGHNRGWRGWIDYWRRRW